MYGLLDMEDERRVLEQPSPRRMDTRQESAGISRQKGACSIASYKLDAKLVSLDNLNSCVQRVEPVGKYREVCMLGVCCETFL